MANTTAVTNPQHQTNETIEQLIRDEHKRIGAYVRGVLCSVWYPGDGTDPEQRDNKCRRYLEWTIAHQAALPPTHRIVLRVILLRQDCYVYDACIAGDATLARNASLSQSRFKAILRRAAFAGHVYRVGTPGKRQTWVTMKYNEEAVSHLRVMWASPRVLVRDSYNRLTPPDTALLRAQHPEEFIDGDDRTDEEMDQLYDVAVKEKESFRRFYWIREVMWEPHSPMAEAAVKGVALVVELLMNSNGRPLRWTTQTELAAYSGYSIPTVQRTLHVLEDGQWLTVTRRRGRYAGGLLCCLRYPPAVAEKICLKEALRLEREEAAWSA